MTIAFDVYGTLIDPLAIQHELQSHVGQQNASNFAKSWREKQLEYTFRRGLMRAYEEFPVCTRQALDYCCQLYDCKLGENERRAVMDCYRHLPAYEDVESCLQGLQDEDLRLFAFSNGVERDVRHLLEINELEKYFEGIVSVDEVQSFKPDPEVYNHFISKTRSIAGETWLVSGNPFDILGARAVGWNTAWLARSETALFDPWDQQADARITSLLDLVAIVRRSSTV